MIQTSAESFKAYDYGSEPSGTSSLACLALRWDSQSNNKWEETAVAYHAEPRRAEQSRGLCNNFALSSLATMVFMPRKTERLHGCDGSNSDEDCNLHPQHPSLIPLPSPFRCPPHSPVVLFALGILIIQPAH